MPRQTQQRDQAFLSELEPSLSTGKKEVVSAAEIFASWNIWQLEYLPAGDFVSTLDSLSPMHAETEGKEPSPSVQLCKVQSR